MGIGSGHLEFYILAKFVAYTLWCALGIQFLWSAERDANAQLATASRTTFGKTTFGNKWLLASGYGLLRLLMGVCFGIVIWILGSLVAASIMNAPHPDVIVYFAVYVPVRWVEWTILDWLMARKAAVGIGYKWRLGGIAISCLADLPVIAAMGWELPLGRFFC